MLAMQKERHCIVPGITGVYVMHSCGGCSVATPTLLRVLIMSAQ
jgi:hypothetical protein